MDRQSIALILLTFFLLFTFVPGISLAYQIQGDDTYIETGDLSIFSEDLPVTLIPSPTAKPKAIQEQKIIQQKQDNNGTKGFNISLQHEFLDFGELEPTNPITRTSFIHVIANTLSGYTVFGWQNHSPVETDGVTVPDTSCDNGACTERTASVWQTPLTYGFGYRCDNTASTPCDHAFNENNLFKQFANESAEERPVPVMQWHIGSDDEKAEISYKINIAASQPQIRYTNTVSYILVPGF